jgi:hypothetical protein
MLATAFAKLPVGEDWSYEIKWDVHGRLGQTLGLLSADFICR